MNKSISQNMLLARSYALHSLQTVAVCHRHPSWILSMSIFQCEEVKRDGILRQNQVSHSQRFNEFSLLTDVALSDVKEDNWTVCLLLNLAKQRQTQVCLTRIRAPHQRKVRRISRSI